MQNNRFLRNINYLLTVIVVCLFLPGCVTEHLNGSGRDKVIDKNKAYDLHVQMALGYIQKGNRDSARLHLKKAVELRKDSAPATGAMAMLFQLEGEPQLAEEQFKLALKRDKNFTEAHNNYGIFLYGQKRYEEAFSEFEKAAADLAYGDRSEAFTNLGRVALKLGNTERAQSAFEHAVILDKNVPDAYLELADLNFQQHFYAEAKKNLDLYAAIGQISPRSLTLGVRLEHIFGNKDKEASLLNQLKNKFPYSNEYLEYKQHNLN